MANQDFTRDQLDLLKQTIAVGATDNEFALFVQTANRLGLDPFAKQIYCVKRYSRDAGGYVMAIQVGVDGFRLCASRTGEADGQDGPFWCGRDGVWRDVWLDEEPPSAAKVVVFRRGKPYVGVATMRSYCQRKKDGGPMALWATMPDVMIAKAAECLALRKAFPAELSGVYGDAEMDQATDTETPSVLDRGGAVLDRGGATAPELPKAAQAALPATTNEAEIADLVFAIRDASTVEELKRLGSQIAKLDRDSAAQLREPYAARLVEIRGKS